MNSFNTNAHDFRSQRKWLSMTGCLIFVLLMSYASCRPSENDDVPLYNDGDYTDADDIDWPNFPIAETTTKDHPIIYYKEDIVSEDYDPNKEKKSSSKEQSTEIKSQSRRKYKEIARRNRLNRTIENYRYIKPEKVFFDVYPIEDDGFKEDDTKFNDNDINVEVISLVDDNNLDNSNNEEKHMLRKKSKKLSRRHRQRRDVLATLAESDAAEHHLRHKRHPFYYRYSFPTYHGAFHQQKFVIYPINSIKNPVKDPRPHNPVSPVGNRRTTTTVPELGPRVDVPSTRPIPKLPETAPVWDSSAVTTERPPRRTLPPLIHSGDEDYGRNTEASISNLNPSPPRAPTRPPSIGIQGNFDQEFPPLPELRPVVPWGRQPQTTRRPSTTRRPTTTTPPPPAESQESPRVSACIWAISACCTKTTNIRYQCFERLGCSGAFWDLNPCAEDIYRLAVEAANQYLE